MQGRGGKTSSSSRSTTPGLTSRGATPVPGRSTPTDPFWGKDDFQWSEVLEQFVKENGSKAEMVVQHVWTDVQDTLARLYIGQLKEVKQMLLAQQKPLEDKLDTILFKMRNLDGDNGLSINCKDLDLQKVNDEVEQMGQQILNITNRVHASMEADQKTRGRVDEQLEKIQSNGENLWAALEKMQNEQRQQGLELSSSIQERLHQRLDQHVTVDWKPVMGKLSKNHFFLEEDFKIIASELAAIKQSINLDYARLGSQPQHSNHAKFRQSVALGSISEKPVQEKQAWPDSFAKEDSTDEVEPFSQVYLNAVRFQEQFVQTDAKQTMGGWVQTDPPEKANPRKPRKSPDKDKAMLRPQVPKLTASPFRDAESMKAKARATLIAPQYNVVNFYKAHGLFSRLAKSSWFENITLAVVTLNTFWIAIDIDNNTAALITDAPFIFQLVENLFCAYFFFEILIRFCAFARKVDAFKDLWFSFDFLLVTNMVVETWIVPIVVVATGIEDMGNTIDLTMLRTFRMVKLLRLSRLAKFLRSFPEIVFVMKAMFFAARSMVVFLVLWMVIVYAFAVVFRQLTSDHAIGEKYFSSVPAAMTTLFFDGILADYAPLMNEIGEANPWLSPVIVFFVLLASVTVMYMLIGVLVEAVDTTVKTEKENMTVEFVAGELREKVLELGYPVDTPIDRKSFSALVVEEDFSRILQTVDVDGIVLLEMTEIIFEDLERNGEEMNFEKMVSVVLDMRGSNPATVKDSKEQIRMLKTIIKQSFEEISRHISDEFTLSNSLMEGFQKGQDYEESDEEDKNAEEVKKDGEAGETLPAAPQ